MATERDREVAGYALHALLRGVAGVSPSNLGSDQVVTGVFDDSRLVQPGGVFFAIRGVVVDGRRFVADAVKRGAAVVIGEELEPRDDAVVINVPNARRALAQVAARWHGLDALSPPAFRLLGVTGTNGKTTTAYMTRAILEAAGLKCGLLGTIQYDLCGSSIAAGMTTPGPIELAGHIRQCVDNGAHAAVMEASSHALDQQRAAGLRFAAAAFTNLTRDHLDYHETFEAYRDAKAQLFANLGADATAVTNADDPQGREIVHMSPARVLTYGIDATADIMAVVHSDSIDGTRFRLLLPDGEVEVESALVGRYNVYNALAAAGLAHAIGLSPKTIAAGLTALHAVPGRLQRVPGPPGVDVFVDYAHTDDALRNVAGVLRPLTRKRLIVVFGCGGERDRGKRPMMAQAAAKFGDVIIVTSDNPRSEDPNAIIQDVLAGFDQDVRRRVVTEVDRRCAIHAALAAAREGDVVLLAGKGHEDYQVVGAERLHFDDVEVAAEALEARVWEREA